MATMLALPDLDRAFCQLEAVYGPVDRAPLRQAYLALLDEVAETGIVPAVDEQTDIMWHFHVLDLENYLAFCDARYGRTIFHRLPEHRLDGSPIAQLVAASPQAVDSTLASACAAAMQCSGPART